MATFKPTSMAGKTTGAKKNTFTPTKYAGYNQSTLYGWQRQNQSALDLINKYNTRVQNGEWLSVEDRAGYKSAIDSYTSSGTELRKASKFYGETGSIGDERRWYDSLSSLNEGYTGINDFYNQFKNDREYGVWKADADKRTEFEGLKNSNDYDYYVNIGKNSEANKFASDIKNFAKANNYSVGDLLADIKDGDWLSIGGVALEKVLSQVSPEIASALKIGSTALDVKNLAKKWTVDKSRMDDYLSEDQMNGYYYLLGKGDYAKADDYFSMYSDEAKRLEAGTIIPKVDNTHLEGLTAFGAGLGSFTSGYEAALSKVGNILYNKDVVLPSSSTLQYVFEETAQNNKGIDKIAVDLANTLGNQVPNMVLNAMTGGVSGVLPMAISAGGNAYAEMRKQGYNDLQATLYGTSIGALEGMLQKALGGIAGMGSDGGFATKAIQGVLPKMTNALGKWALQASAGMLDEGLEESLQEVLAPIVQGVITGEYNPSNIEDVLYAGLLGGLSGGLLEGVPSAVNTARTEINTKKAFGDQANAIVADAIAIDPTNAVAMKSQNRMSAGKGVSGTALDTLLTTTDRARVKDAITNQLTEYGETSDISALAEALTKQTMGEELSKKESKLIEASKYGNRITNELNPNNIKSGQYTSKWAESIGTRRLNADVYSRRPSTKVKTKDGTNNTITNVRNVADGVATVELADGKVAKVGLEKGTTSDLVFNDPKTEGLFRIATDRVGKVEGWTTETANAMIKAYEGSTLDASAFARGWSEAYNIGKSNNSQAQLNNSSWAMLLDNKTRADAYNIGKAMSTPRVMAPTTNTYKVSFDSSVDEGSLTNKQKTQIKALDVISKALGVNVVVFDSPMGADGKRVGKNGSYNPNTRTVEIDLHAGADGRGVMLFTASHELTHHMKEVAKDKFNAYADAVFEALGENGRDLIESKLSALRANGHLDGKTDEEAYDLAFEEVVADSAEKMLVDTDALVKLSESLKSKDKTLWEKVKDYIVGLVNKIKKIYASLEPDSQEARMVSEMEDEIENIRKLWVEGIVASAEVSDKVAAQLGVEIDTASESVSPTLMSERTWTESEYVVNRNAMAKKIALALNISERKAKKYIDDVNSIARMIANDRVRLDYQASSFGSAFVSNVEYGGSFDYTTLCKKRRLYTGTFSEIQKRLHDVALSPDEILTVRNMLIEAHKEATCGLCYVEGSRANMGKFAQKFIELYKRDNPDSWIPNMVDVNTPDGVEQMRINHPEAYEQYEYFWNHYGKLKDSDPALFASQQKPKLYEARKEYKGEILTHFKGETTIEKKNLNGGIRMQSFSDFEIIHLIDTMQVIMDMSTVGLAGQAYTKVPEFALAFGNTGLKINLSLIAKGVDENGKLIFDDREGMPHETAFDIRNKYSQNVGTIIVTFTDDQLMAAMADDRIDYIIPFHRSQWKKGQYGAMGLPKGTKDYTFMQNEKLIKQTYHEYQGRMVKDKATNYMPNEYWDFSKSGKENAEAYLKMCAENNKRPKFYKLLDYDGNGTYTLKKGGSTDGYWKLLIDFKMYDNNGKGSPQTPVVPNFNMEESTKMMEEYKGGHEKYPIAYDVVDKFVEQYNKDMGTKYSLRGINKDGIEVYETSEETMNLTWKEREAKYLDIMKNEYRGRTAKFVRNGHTYYAQFDPKGVRKVIKGDDRTSKNGLKAVIKAGADGDIFDLVERSTYSHSSKNRKNHTPADYFDYFVKTVQIDGKVYDLIADVEKMYGGDGGYVYTLALTDNTKIKASPAHEPPQRASVIGARNASTNSISQNSDLSTENLKNSDRLSSEEAFSNRSLLANALLDTVQSDIEYKKLDDYRTVIGYLEAEEVKLADLKRKIYDATFGDGDKSKLKELREEARKTEARIDLHDKKLLQLESTTALRNVLERAKKQAYSKALEKGREAMHRNVEGRYKTIERNKIVKVAKELANLLEKGNKKRNIKNGAQDIVRAALDLSNMYFESDDNIIMNGIVAEATDAENLALAKYRSLYEQLHATDDDVTNHKEERKALREQMNEVKKELLSLLERERNRISKSKARDSMLALATAYGELKNADEDYLRLAYKQEVQERLTSLAGELGDTLIADMSLKQLEALYDAFSMVKHLVTDSNKLFRDGKKEDLAKRVSGVFEDLSTLTNRLNGDYPEWLGKVLNRINEFGWNNLRPVDVFELIGSSNLEDLYWDAIKAQDVYARDVEEYKAALIKARRENNYKSWDLSKTQTFKTADGELKLTLAEMMSIYAYSHREQADEHLRVGGIQFAKEATYKNDKGTMTMRGKEAHTYRVGDGVRLDIINALTKEQRAYVDTIQALLTAWGEKGNEVSRVLYGIDLFKDENYFPLRSSKDFLSSVDTEMGKTITTASLSGSGFTKSVVPHANNPIILEAFDDVVNNHIDKMSKYHAYVIPIENLRKILDAQTKDSSDLTRSVKQIISSKLGDGAKGYLEQYITDLNGGIKTGYNNGLMGLFGKAKGAQVAANLSVWVQQYFSVIRAMAEVNAKYFIPFMGESYRNPDMKLYDEMKKYAPITTIKEMGGFDVGSNRGVAEYVGYEESKVTRGKIDKKMQDTFGVGAALMDKLGWITIWKAVKKEVASTNQYKVGSEEFYKACGERFERVIAKTQVYDSVNARSGNMRNKSDWWKMATSFMGEPTAILGMAEVAIVNYNRAKTPAEKKAAGARLATTISTITISTALTSIAKSLVYAMRDDDEDEDYLEKYASALAGAFKDDLNILNYIPIARDIVSILEGFTVERPDMALIEDLISAVKKVVDTDEDETTEQKADEAINLAGSLANLSGVPLKNIIRDIAGLYNLVESLGKGYKTDFGGEFKENWFLGKERTKSENIYNAVIRGDTKRSDYYKSTYKDESSYNTALRKAIRDNDPRLEEAALARLNGDRDTYYRLMMDVIDEGNFDKQIIKDAFDAEYNYQKRLAEENK